MKTKLLLLFVVLSSFFAGCVVVPVARPARPAVIIERRGPVPHRGAVWMNGEWVWRRHHWVWVHGYWR
jgi:hypothetical protein